MLKKLIFLLIFLLSSTVNAYVNQNIDDIRAVALKFAKAKVTKTANADYEFKIKQLDERLNLAKCGNKLATDLLRNNVASSSVTVLVSCNAPKPWKVYVPIAINVTKKVVVANTNMSRGKVISASDIRLSNVALNNLASDYYTDTNDLIGKLVKSNLRNGMIISNRYIDLPNIISRGENIVIKAGLSNLVVKVMGEAMQDGKLGDRIRVKNNDSKRMVEGKVIAPGVVQVNI